MTKPTIHFTTRADRFRRARRDPLVARLSALVIAGIVIAPVAILIGHSQGHHTVRSGNLPGAAVGLTPGPTSGSTVVGTTTTSVAPAAAVPAPVPATLPPAAVTGTLPPTAVSAGTLPATIAPPTTAATTTEDVGILSSGDGSSAGSGSGSPGSDGSSGSSGGSGGGSIWSGGSQATATTSAPVVTQPPPPPPTTQAPPPRQWDVATVQQIIRNVFPDDQEEHALAIAYRESHFDPYARNYCCTGLFQIYGSVHERLINSLGFSVAQLTDPYVNAVVAYALYQLDGWGPWGG